MDILSKYPYSFSFSRSKKQNKTERKYKMDFWTNAILFFLILIFYLHLQHEWKKGEDLEILEMDYISNKDLQDICKLKQPVLFQLAEMESIFSFVPDEKDEVTVKDIRDYYRDSTETAINGISLAYKSANGLFSTDPHSYFFSENNTDLSLPRKTFDSLLSPPLTISSKYDYLFGSANAYTPVRYHTESSRFLAVLPGQGIRVKMVPWKNRAHFSSIKDYENYEFWSKTDIWKYTSKSLEFDVKPGYILYIPAYWFYSIQFIKVAAEEIETRISPVISFQYITVMNMIANSQNYALYFLQQQNIVETKSRVLTDKKVEVKKMEADIEKDLDIEVKKDVQVEISPQVAETIAMLQPKEEM